MVGVKMMWEKKKSNTGAQRFNLTHYHLKHYCSSFALWRPNEVISGSGL